MTDDHRMELQLGLIPFSLSPFKSMKRKRLVTWWEITLMALVLYNLHKGKLFLNVKILMSNTCSMNFVCIFEICISCRG